MTEPGGRGAALAWLPGDGQARTVRLSSGGLATAEDALGPGVEVVQSLSQALSAAFDSAGVEHLRLWRQTVSPADVDADQWTGIFTTGDSVSLALDAVGDDFTSYRPALPVLPPGVQAGDQWRAEGTFVSGELGGPETASAYRASMSAVPEPGGCLRVTAVVLADTAGADGADRLSWTFCPGQGRVAVADSTAGGPGFAPADGAAVVADTQPVRPTEPAQPTGEPTPARVGTTVTGDLPGTGAPDAQLGVPQSLSPVALGSDRVAWPNTALGDLLIFAAAAEPALTLRRRLHPGGTVLSVAAIDRTLIATTTNRSVVAWTDAGVRRWLLSTDDVVAQPPVALDASTIAVATASGWITAVDLATGRPRWSRHIGAPIAVPIGVGAGTVVADRVGGGVTVLDAATGEIRWRAEGGEAAEGVAVAGGHVVVSEAGNVTGYALADGARQWTNRPPGATGRMVGGDDALVVATTVGVSEFAAGDGSRRWSVRERCEEWIVEASWIGCWSTDSGVVLDRTTGRVIAPLSVSTIDGARYPVVLGDRVWLFDRHSWSAWVWTDG